MNNANNKLTSSPKRLAWTAAALCVGCCAVIPVLGLLGVTVAAGLRFYFEAAAIGLFIASLTLFGYYYLVLKNKAQSCQLDCSCKDAEN